MEIQLDKGFTAIIDDADCSLVKNYKWYSQQSHGKVYAVAYLKKVKRKTFYVRMHRLIIGVEIPSVLVDHRDHNGLNNQRSNLRICSNMQNNRNRKGANKNAKSSYLGVSPKITKYKTVNGVVNIKTYWDASIHPGRKIHLGTFKSELEAAHAYDVGAKKHFGEFASLNFR